MTYVTDRTDVAAGRPARRRGLRELGPDDDRHHPRRRQGLDRRLAARRDGDRREPGQRADPRGGDRRARQLPLQRRCRPASTPSRRRWPASRKRRRADLRLAINSQLSRRSCSRSAASRRPSPSPSRRRSSTRPRTSCARWSTRSRSPVAAAQVARLPRPDAAGAGRRRRPGLGVGRPDRLDLVRRHERELQVGVARGRRLQRRGHRRRQRAVVGDAHRAGAGSHPGVPGDGQLLLRGVRPLGVGRHQHPDQVGRQPDPRQRLLFPPRRRLRQAELLRGDRAAVQDRAVRRHRRRPDRPEPALLLRVVGEARQRALGAGQHPGLDRRLRRRASATTPAPTCRS